MTEAEALSVINENYRVLDGPQLLHKLIQWQQDTCALDFLSANGERWRYSYLGLRECVASITSLLLVALEPAIPDAQARPHIIPILLPQSPALYISILAILEAGAAFCPINLDAPLDRIKFVIGDVSADVIVTTREYEHLVAWEGGPHVFLIDESPPVPNGNCILPSVPSRLARPQDLAYVMYTSGSSGTPKGVAVSHLAVSQSLLAHETHIPHFKRFLQFAAPSFDVSVFEIFFPLFRGSTLVGSSRPQMLNDLTGVINKLEVDAAELTPTVVSSLVQQRSDVPGLKLLLTIGEMLTRPVVDSFGKSGEHDSILYAMYGPTEAAIHCTINPQMKSGTKAANIGVPFDTVSTFIAATEECSSNQAEIKLLPIGEVGELILGGPQLATGYLNREDQNRIAFTTVRGQRVYRTGDKARVMADGTLEILGRISSGQVKLRGQRVELGEIEEAVCKHPGIKAVSASVLHGVLIVFILTWEPDTTPEDILKTCSSWLPTFMVPSKVVLLDKFPHLPSGKVNKKELEASFEAWRTEGSQGTVEAQTHTEHMISNFIRDLLGATVSYTAHLAVLGLDSLVAIRLASLLRSAGFNLSPVEILKADSIKSLARTCEDSSRAQNSGTLPDADIPEFTDTIKAMCERWKEQLNFNAIDYVMPCTPLQDAILSETGRDTVAYKNRIELELPKAFNGERVRAAVQALAQTDAILRTGFIEWPNHGSAYSQVVWKTLSSTQFNIINHSSSEAENPQPLSLLHPLYVQIHQYEECTRLLLHINHALYDAWSLELILDDLESILNNSAAVCRPSFSRVVREYYGTSRTENLLSLKEYWRDHLAQLDIRNIPNLHSVINKRRGLKVATLQPSIVMRDLELTARGLCVSSQSLFQAAYALILSFYLGSRDICFGTVFSGRTAAIVGIEDIVGPCFASLPIRVDLTTVSTTGELVRLLNSINRKHLEHISLPLREIKKCCGIDPGQPLLNSLLVWQQTLHAYNHRREHVTLIDSTDYLEFDLTLEIIPGPEYILLKANYQQAIFPRGQIDLLLRQVEQVVLTFIKSPDVLLNLVIASFSENLLSIENSSPRLDFAPGSLTASVESMAIDYPDSPAIDFALAIEGDNLDVQRITYGELNSQANQIAHHLVSYNVLPDELVCIYMEKSAELYISILATVKVGAGYLPVMPDAPPARLAHMLSEANIKVILTQSSLSRKLDTISCLSIILVDNLDLSLLSSNNLAIKYVPENLAYCVFTSGSTGVPKGVLVTKGNLLSNLQVLAGLYPHSHTSRLLQSCSQAFDVSVFEIFFAWHIGACLCSAVKDVMFRDIEFTIRKLDITHLSLTPTVAALVCPENVPKVEFLVTAGEAVTQRVFDAWADHGLHQGYGPSEMTNICTIKLNVTKHDSINNIGPPLQNTSVFVLFPGDDFLPVPRGGEGEFCFGGAQVGRGYLRAIQGVNKFIEHPKYGRLYRSGDYGRLLSDGTLRFTERKDDQVKVRGQRVELSEVNSIVLGSSEVHDCVSLIVEGENQGDQRIVCFWTPAPSPMAEFASLIPDGSIAEKLFACLAAALPAYMLPSALVPVSCLPSTTQGKIDKCRLIKHYKSLGLACVSQASYQQETAGDHIWTSVEVDIAKTVAKITKVSSGEIGPDTSFFSLGIDSISAISLSRALRDEAGLQTEISDILKYPSVSKLAGRASKFDYNPDLAASKLDDFGFDPHFLAATKESFADEGKLVEWIAPCTPLQEAMLLAAEMSSSHAYCNQLVLDIKVCARQLEDAWAKMVERHDILRTCFVKTNHPRFAYAQVVLTKFVPTWGVIDDSGEELALYMSHYLASRTANYIEYNPPYGLCLIVSSRSTTFILSMHHVLYDGYAISVLFNEIETVLRNEKLRPPVSFVPFLHYMSTIDIVKAEAYWDNLLTGFHPTSLRDNATGAEERDNEKHRSNLTRICSECRLTWVEDRTKAHRTSLLSICQTAWASLLSIYLDETDICFGNVVSGRTIPVEKLDRLVAPCFNTVPVRVKDLQSLSFLETFRILQSQYVDCLPFQLTPLRRIQSRLGTDGMRIFDTLLILQQPARELDPSLWSITEDRGAMDLPIVIEIIPRPSQDTLDIVLHSHCLYMSEVEAVELLNIFDSILKMALQNPRNSVCSTSCGLVRKDKRRAGRIKRIATEGSNQHSEFMNPIESEIRDIVAKYTDIPSDKIQRNTSIYRLGLDSINAVQVAMSLRKQGYRVIGSDVLQHSSIAKLAIYLIERQGASEGKLEAYDFKAFEQKHREAICTRLGLSPKNIESIRPCTPVQCGMLAQCLHGDGREYISSFCMELLPGTSLEKIRSAWESAMKQHEMLRTGFMEIEETTYPFAMVTYSDEIASLPWIQSRKDSSDGLRVIDLSNMAIDHLSRCPWNLEVINEASMTLVKFRAHHALYDAHSLELILADIAYNYALETSEPLMDHLSINPLLAAILNATDRNGDARKEFWQEKNKICINRFPDLTPLRQSSSKSLVREIFCSLSIAQLEKLCREQDASIQAAGQAAWGRLLSAYIGEPSVTFGLTLSGRSILDDSERVAFPTIVTLPVSCDVSGTNAELLSRTVRTNAQLHEHQFTPLTSIQKWTGHPEGKMFDTLFAYQKIKTWEKTVQTPWRVITEEAWADYAVSMEIQPTESGMLQLRLTFKDKIVPIEQADLLLEQFNGILIDTLQNGDGSAASFLALRKDLLSITPPTEPTLLSPVQLLHEFVEMQARRIPHKTAFEFTTRLNQGCWTVRRWTFKQLNCEGNKTADLLLELGAHQGDLIAICFHKCPEASFAILGILKAGCAYVALDPDAPPNRIKFIVEDSRSSLILTAGKPARTLSGIFRTTNVKVFDVGGSELMNGCSATAPVLHKSIDPQDTCYCLYTSGTTGAPKGCEINHENAVQAMVSFQELFKGHWTEDSKWLQFASFHFDVSVLEQFWSWSVGICVASAPRDLIFEDIPRAIRRLYITHIDLTPSVARLLRPEDVPSLTKGVFITGGEQLKQEILEDWGDYKCIYNGYGPTETTIGVTMHPRVPKNGKPANIGPQFPNVGSYVLKLETAEPVPRGAIGELCVSGKLLGKGYLNRPRLTKERFPYLKDFGERVYRTGDLVRILYDGSFLFIGRADDQVKLRGQRLELSEINEVVKKHVPGLQDVVTLMLKHSGQQKEQLVTFFVTSSVTFLASRPDFISHMLDVCQGHLPAYMVPTYFISLDELPLSANNKTDFKQLAKIFDNMSIMDLQKLSSSGRRVGRWSNEERAVLTVLGHALKVDTEVLTNRTNLFELGIDSISVIGLARNLQKAGYINAKLSVVMRNTSIESLVRVLASESRKDSAIYNPALAASQRIAAFSHKHKVAVASELGIDASSIECLAPCTPAQEGMIYRFLSSLEAIYFTRFDLMLDSSIDETRLQEAWLKTAQQLQVLRTKFVLISDGCAQVVLKDPSNVKHIWGDSSTEGSGDDDIQQRLQRRSSEIGKMDKATALANPFNISFYYNQTTRIMSLTLFHALYDGISLPLLFHKVRTWYQDQSHLDLNQHVDYGPNFHTVLPYGPLAILPSAEAFWRHAIRGWELQPIPYLANNVSQKDTSVSVSKTLTIPWPTVTHLSALRKSLGVTNQSILLAAWGTVLYSHLCVVGSNLTFGLVISGRSIDFPNAERVIGPLLNTVPFHVNLYAKEGRAKTWGEFITACHSYTMAMLPFQHTALKDIQKWCGQAGKALFDTLFVFQQQQGSAGDDDDSEIKELWTELPTEPVADYPLAFEAQLNNGGDILLTIVTQRNVLDESAAAQLLTEVKDALQALQSLDELIPVPSSLMTPNKHRFKQTDANIANTQHEKPTSSSNLDLDSGVFTWTPSAQALKAEIESLAGPHMDINESTSIFSLGLDSIDMIKLVSRLRERGIYISVSSVVHSQTISKMVGEISMDQGQDQNQNQPRSGSATAAKSIRWYEQKLMSHLRALHRLPENAITALPATPLQEGMVAEMISSQYTRYFNHEVFRVAKHVNMEKLKEAWDITITKHDILRTVFIEVDDVELPASFAQVICAPVGSFWHRVELKGSANIGVEMERITQTAAERAKEGALLQLVDIRYGQDQYFSLSISHALYDGWSLQALHLDVWAAYHGSITTRPSPRPMLEFALNTDGADAMKFWKISLTSLQKSVFPQKQWNNNKRTRTVHRRERLSRYSVDKVQTFCRSMSVSIQTVGQTSWALLLATYLKRLEVVFGAVLSCRDTEEANEVMFPLMNTVAVRSVIHGSIAEMLGYMQDNWNSVRRYQHFPLRRAQALAGIHDGNLFDSLFIYQGRARRGIADQEKLYESVQTTSEVEFAVCVEMEIVGEALVWRTACKETVQTTAETDLLLDCLDDVLGRIIENPVMPTISADATGISVCGLQTFLNETSPSQITSNVPELVSRSPTLAWTAQEIAIRKVLSQVSKVPEGQIDKDQTIFHLGLDSISAIKVSSILRRKGIKLSVNEIMKHNSIVRMAKILDGTDTKPAEMYQDVDSILADVTKSVDREDVIRSAGVDPENVEDMMPVTAGQLYMLARWQASGGTLFVGTFKYRISSAVIEDRLEEAWKALLRRHPILRTVFVITGYKEPRAVQLVLRDMNNSIKWMASSAPENSCSLTSPLLLSIEKHEEESILCLRIHHALYDGISLPLLLRDLQGLYRNPFEEVSPDFRFRQFVAQGHGGQMSSLHRRRDFWTSYLSTSTILTPKCAAGFPSIRREVLEQSMQIGNIASIAQRTGASVDALLLAGFSKIYRNLLSEEDTASAEEHSDRDSDVIFGLYLANRAIYGEDLSTLAAPTLNLLPIRVTTTKSLTEIAQKVQLDLQQLSSVHVAGTSLAEIYEWTGVRVNCFVNILKSSDEDLTVRMGPDHLFEEGEDVRWARAQTVQMRDDPQIRAETEKHKSRLYEAYLPSVDIEMRVTSDGKGLDIGVFAPCEYLDVADSRRVVEEMRLHLGGF